MDTVCPELGLKAVQRSLDTLGSGKGVLLCDRTVECRDSRVRIVRIASLRGVAEYSRVVFESLLSHVATDHALIVQWDGFALNASAWDSTFLDYDYIGAPWPQFSGPVSVGNGGFSLRSRKLLRALRDPDMILHSPEDLCICHTNRQLLEDRYAIRFAPPEIAQRFSFERLARSGPTFGFHGLFNFPEALPTTYREEIAKVPASRLTSRDAVDLGAALWHSGDRRDRKLAWRIVRAIAGHRPAMLPRLAKSLLGS